MKTILFIHSAGTQGPHQGSYDFVEWLRRTLGPSYRILFPLMHDPETPEYAAWKEQLERELILIGGDLILIGHSLGGSVVLKFLSEEKFSNNITAIFLIATPFWGADEDWNVGDYILKEGFEEKIPNVPINLYHSINDPWVPSQHTTLYQQKLKNASVNFLDGDDHEFQNGLPLLAEDVNR